MSEHYSLRCRECHRDWGNRPSSICLDCLAPLEVHYDLDAVRGTFTKENIGRRAGERVALRRIASDSGRIRFGAAGGDDAAGGCAAARKANWSAAASCEKRCGVLPYPFVQRSRGGDGAGAGEEFRISNGELLFDRQSGEFGGGAGGAAWI